MVKFQIHYAIIEIVLSTSVTNHCIMMIKVGWYIDFKIKEENSKTVE